MNLSGGRESWILGAWPGCPARQPLVHSAFPGSACSDSRSVFLIIPGPYRGAGHTPCSAGLGSAGAELSAGPCQRSLKRSC